MLAGPGLGSQRLSSDLFHLLDILLPYLNILKSLKLEYLFRTQVRQLVSSEVLLLDFRLELLIL